MTLEEIKIQAKKLQALGFWYAYEEIPYHGGLTTKWVFSDIRQSMLTKCDCNLSVVKSIGSKGSCIIKCKHGEYHSLDTFDWTGFMKKEDNHKKTIEAVKQIKQSFLLLVNIVADDNKNMDLNFKYIKPFHELECDINELLVDLEKGKENR